MTTQLDFVSPAPTEPKGDAGGGAAPRKPRKATAPPNAAQPIRREQLDLFGAPGHDTRSGDSRRDAKR